MTLRWDPEEVDDVDLLRLLHPAELTELLAATTKATSVPLAISDRFRNCLAGDRSLVCDDAIAYPVTCAGEPVYWVYGASRAADGAAGVLVAAMEIAAHHAYAKMLAINTHDAAMEENFEEVTKTSAQLARSVTRLEEVDRVKSQILANMSHELRTPLTAVVGYAEMMVDGYAGPITDDQRTYLSTILNKADQLLQLITSVLDVSQLETSAPQEPPGLVTVAEVLRSELANFVPVISRRQLVIETGKMFEGRVLGSPRKLRQIVASLLSNAVKFSPDNGRVRLEVRYRNDRYRAHALELEVTDQGVGIAPSVLVHIFEPFFQVDPSSTRAYGGTGIGLTLVKSYVEAHGGQVTVKSELGKGSTFVVALPLADGEPAPAVG